MNKFSKILTGLAFASTTVTVNANLSYELGLKSRDHFHGTNISQETSYGSVSYAANNFRGTIKLSSGWYNRTNYSLAYNMPIGGLDVTASFDFFDNNWDGVNAEQREFTLATSIKGLGVSYTSGKDDHPIYDYQPTSITQLILKSDYEIVKLNYSVIGLDFLIGFVEIDTSADTDYNYFEISRTVDIAGVSVTAQYSGEFGDSDYDDNVNYAYLFAGDRLDDFSISVKKEFDL
jgi:hypothetical protein